MDFRPVDVGDDKGLGAFDRNKPSKFTFSNLKIEQLTKHALLLNVL